MREVDLDSKNIHERFFKMSEVNKVLVVAQDEADLNNLTALLTEAIPTRIEVATCHRLDTCLEMCSSEKYDMVFLDLNLPDSLGVDSFTTLYSHHPDVAIIVTVTPDEEPEAVRATQLGAKDYLIKQQYTSAQIKCSIKYAIEQQNITAELSSMELLDETTGLYNRSSFLVLLQHYQKLAARSKRGLTFVFARLNNLAGIDDAVGQRGVKRVLIDAANILRQTFRRSDIISKFAKDEFAILALESNSTCDSILTHRLNENLQEHNKCSEPDLRITLQIGTAFYDPQAPLPLAELMARARRSQCLRVEET